MRVSAGRRRSGAVLLAAGVTAIVLANTGSTSGTEVAAGWWVAAGFTLIGAGGAMLGGPSEAAVMSLVFALYVGVSAALAALLPARDLLDGPAGLGGLRRLPFLRVQGGGAPQLAPSAFFPTLMLASSAALVCLAVIFVLARSRAGGGEQIPLDGRRLAQAANILIGAGLIGASLAAIRFVAEHHRGPLSANTLQSFWRGGAYLIFLAQFAIPGLGLRLSLLVERAAPRGVVLRTAAAFIAFLLITIPTGERGFLIEGGLVIVAVMATHRRWVRPLIAPAVLIGLVALIVTQAARDSLRLHGTASPSAVIHLLSPDRWDRTLENQFASFQWAADLHAYGSALHGTNPLLALLAKPVPRQIWPGKPEGLSHEFTAAVYPSAAATGVSFAVPLYAELEFATGALGAVIGLGLVGAMLAGSGRAARRWPAALAPVTRSLFLWAAFELIRGDLSNSVPLAVATLLPIAFIVWWARIAEPDTLILDALAVPPSYSGVGETVRRLGADLAARQIRLRTRLIVRCAADVRDRLAPSFPAGTEFHTPLPSSRPSWRRLVYQLGVAPLRDRPASIVLSASEIGTWWGRARRVLIVHDLRRRTAPATAPGSDRRLYNVLVPLAVKQADAILTVSRTTAESLAAELSPPAPVTIVAPHSGLAMREPVAGEQPADRRAAPELIVVSAVRSYKGAEVLLDALGRLPVAARPRIGWVGAIELDASAAAALRRRALEHGVELLGWLPEAELALALDRAQGLLAPSRFEGYGMSLLEGLRRGLPVLASDIPSHREIAGDAAIYFAPRDPAALAAVLARFARGELDRARHGELSRRRALELSSAGPSWGEALVALVASFCVQATDPEGSPAPAEHAEAEIEPSDQHQPDADPEVHR